MTLKDFFQEIKIFNQASRKTHSHFLFSQQTSASFIAINAIDKNNYILIFELKEINLFSSKSFKIPKMII